MNAIRQFRKLQGITQTKLAARLGLSQGHLSELERGKIAPWPKVRRDLALVLGTTESELFPASSGNQEATCDIADSFVLFRKVTD